MRPTGTDVIFWHGRTCPHCSGNSTCLDTDFTMVSVLLLTELAFYLLSHLASPYQSYQHLKLPGFFFSIKNCQTKPFQAILMSFLLEAWIYLHLLNLILGLGSLFQSIEICLYSGFIISVFPKVASCAKFEKYVLFLSKWSINMLSKQIQKQSPVGNH